MAGGELSRKTMRRLLLLALAAAVTFSSRTPAGADALDDLNGDGQTVLLGFGDSITYGVGDGIAPDIEVGTVPMTDGRSGYPARIESGLGVPVHNRGIPGEFLIDEGLARLPSAVMASNADAVVIMHGNNDARVLVSAGEYRVALQKSVNVIRALGRTPIVASLPVPCCDHSGQSIYARAFSQVTREVAADNELVLADIERSWVTSCGGLASCRLLNRPEGLHPNLLGYDVIGQTIMAALLGIDIFAADGAAALEEALGLPAGTVVVKPDQAPM